MQSKRFATIAEYQRATGLSYKTIKNALETGQLKGIKTDAGHWKIDMAHNNSEELNAIKTHLAEQGVLLKAMCEHFGVLRR